MAILRNLVSAAAILGGLATSASINRRAGVPSDNGFPNPDDQQILSIAQQAGGKPPGGPGPTSVGDNTATALQLIAFNELFETAYFSSLLNNITSNAPGYEHDDQEELIKIFSTVLAQEEIHALSAISVLKGAGRFAPSACDYTFPVTDLKDAVNLAETFTAVVLGALQGANVIFAKDGVFPLVQVISSVIGQEGEQNGYYRYFLEEVPSESPFLTYVPAAFAFSALQSFVVPNSCPFPLSDINLPIFPPISTNGGAVAAIGPEDQTLSFSADLTGVSEAQRYIGGDGSGLFMTYTTGQQLPFPVPISNVRWSGSTISFDANFPYSELIAQGFSHGELTITNVFDSADAVVNCALAGPAVIQVSNPL